MTENESTITVRMGRDLEALKTLFRPAHIRPESVPEIQARLRSIVNGCADILGIIEEKN